MTIQNPIPGLAVAFCVSLSAPAFAADIYVPTDEPTIMAAVNAAQPGDEIIVEPGVYSDLVIIYKPDLTIRSEFPEAAVIDATGIASTIILSEVEEGAGPLPVLEGFEIRGGNTSPPVWSGSHQGDPGLGLVIRDCWFHDNDAGAIKVHDSFVNIQSCRFERNWSHVGAIIEADNAGGVITDCHFYANTGEDAGAVALRNSEFGIYSCVFEQGIASGLQYGGGGIFMEDCSWGRVMNCLFYQNLTKNYGAAMHVRGASDIEIDHCTITGNAEFWEPVGSGLFVGVGANVEVRNSIIRGNYTSSDIVAFGTVDIEYSCVPAAFSGTGNVHGAPGFVNSAMRNYQLRLTSPCVDAGNGTETPGGHPYDLGGNNRFTDDPEVTDTGVGPSPVVDIGCYERVPFIYGIRYVDADAAPGGDGMTWATAFNELTDALAQTPSPDISEIWVAEGYYFPDNGTGDRSMSFHLDNGVRLFGGFDGTEQIKEERDWINHETILSGNVGNLWASTDNSYHVVTLEGSGYNITLNGFTVQGGWADGADANDQRGAGLFVEEHAVTDEEVPIIRRCTFRNNWSNLAGGAVFIEGRNMSFFNCRFVENTSATRGGAIRHGLNFLEDPTHTNIYGCEFIQNVSERGGGISAYTGSLDVINSTFFQNESTQEDGGGLFARSSTVTVASSIFWQNSASIGNKQAQQLSVTNTLSIDKSCVEGWNGSYGGSGNIGSDPIFIDPVGGVLSDPDLRLCSDSPCVDTGANESVPASLNTDVLGRERIVNTTVDMGCYEDTGDGLVLMGPSFELWPGANLELSTCGGWPLGAMILSVTAVNGVPVFVPISSGFFDFDGRDVFSAIIPGGLSGLQPEFTTYGFTSTGAIGQSNPVTVTLQ